MGTSFSICPKPMHVEEDLLGGTENLNGSQVLESKQVE
jgi:hypothetical protein